MTSPSLVTLNQPNSYITERYKMFRANLNYINIDQDKKIILITSAMPEEGKSTTSCNLAITMAQEYKKVLLIDGDLRCPSLHKIFRVSQLPGMTNALINDKPLLEIINNVDDVPGLDLLTAGTFPVRPTELLSSIKFKTLIEEVKDMYDYIIIDAPPVLSVTDTAVMSSIVDGVIMVFAANESSKSSVVKATKALKKVGANLLGVVLTKTKTEKQYNYHGYFKN